MTLPGGGPFRMIDNGFRNELEANNRSVGGLVLHVFDQADMRRARVAKRRLRDVYSVAQLSHIPYSPVGNRSMCFAGESRTHRSMARRPVPWRLG